MTHTAVKIAVIESERGWGRKVDDWMVCLSVGQANEWKEEYNSQNTATSTPDWYMQCEGGPELIDLNEKQYAELKRAGGHKWLSSLNAL